MKNTFFTIILLFAIANTVAQKPQRIAYIDMEYILENVPEYLSAQNSLNSKVQKWRKNLDKQARHIEILKTDLVNEKALLTKDLIDEKEEEISLKEDELRRLESLYFGPKGDMFLLRKQLVKPIQDQVYNAIQNIAARKKYDFVFDKSSDLTMLYSNKKYDISDLILSMIDRSRKIKEKSIKKAPKKELTKNQKKIIEKKEIAKTKKTLAKEKQKKLIDEKRKARLKERAEKRKLLQEKKEALRRKKQKKD